MFKWLLRIGLGLLVTKLAEEFMHPSRDTRARAKSEKPAPKRRRRA